MKTRQREREKVSEWHSEIKRTGGEKQCGEREREREREKQKVT